MEKERKNALEMGKEKKKENKESTEEKGRQALTLMLVVGIDLAGSPKRDSGFCEIDRSKHCATKVLHTDSEIIEAVERARPKVVSIDAPLSLPRGRKSINQLGPHFRQCDLELRKLHIRFFPITLGPMRMLTSRGIRLKKSIEAIGKGIKVIESFPGGALDLLGMPRKQRGLGALRKSLVKYGLKGLRNNATGDELDAATCAIVGLDYINNNYMRLGDPEEGVMIMPKPRHK